MKKIILTLVPCALVFTFASAFVRLGFEWVFVSGFVFSLGGGEKWDNYLGIGPNLVLTLGYAW